MNIIYYIIFVAFLIYNSSMFFVPLQLFEIFLWKNILFAHLPASITMSVVITDMT